MSDGGWRIETVCPRCGGYMGFLLLEAPARDELTARVEHLGPDGQLYVTGVPITRSLLQWQFQSGGITLEESVGDLWVHCVDQIWAEVRCDEEPPEVAEEPVRLAGGGWITAGTMSEDGIALNRTPARP